MSYSAERLKAQLLLNELNRRTRLFGILRGRSDSSWWERLVSVLLCLFAAWLIWGAFEKEQVFALLVLVMVVGMEIGALGAHRKIDALVSLLQQEGLLESMLPAAKRDEPKNEPSGGEGKNRMG